MNNIQSFIRRHGLFFWWLGTAILLFALVRMLGVVTHETSFNNGFFDAGFAAALPLLLLSLGRLRNDLNRNG